MVTFEKETLEALEREHAIDSQDLLPGSLFLFDNDHLSWWPLELAIVSDHKHSHMSMPHGTIVMIVAPNVLRTRPCPLIVPQFDSENLDSQRWSHLGIADSHLFWLEDAFLSSACSPIRSL